MKQRLAAIRHFAPWRDTAERSCWTCAPSIGYDDLHLWWQRAGRVVVMPCGSWERSARSDEASSQVFLQSAECSFVGCLICQLSCGSPDAR